MKLRSANIIASVVIITVIAVIVFPLYIIFYIEPSFNNFIVTNTEKDAAKLGQHLSNIFFQDSQKVDNGALSQDVIEMLQGVQNDFHIIKIKLFTANGEIIYSTESRDIGTLNSRGYFQSIVARGELYTKIVHKNATSLEGKTMPADVVEVYVPIMHGKDFAGAFEIYYDITAKRKELSSHIDKMTKSSLLIAFFLLGAVLLTTRQASKNLLAKEEMEHDLQHAYDNLEKMVTDRTLELTEANEALEREISVRKETEHEKEKLISKLQTALEQVKTLSGLLPICSSCQQIRDSEGKWSKVDEYIRARTNVEFTHGICPRCAKKLYPDLYEDIQG